MKQNNFKEEMLDKVIPTVVRMISKEEKHLSFLEKNNAPKEMIDNSKFHLEHFKKRLIEYNDYVNKI